MLLNRVGAWSVFQQSRRSTRLTCTRTRAYNSEWAASNHLGRGPYLLALVDGSERIFEAYLGTQLLPCCQVGYTIANQTVIFVIHAGIPVLFPGLRSWLPASLQTDKSEGNADRKLWVVGGAKLSQMVVRMLQSSDWGTSWRGNRRRKRDKHIGSRWSKVDNTG